MATIVKSVSFKADGVPQAGLSPTVTARNLATGADLSGSIAVAGIGDGMYSVTYTYATAVPCRVIVNAGTDVIDSRYMDVEFTVADINASNSVVQTADHNVILASASKGLVKVYDDMAKQASLPALGTDSKVLISTDAMTESYAADGAAPSPQQLLFMLWSLLSEKDISSTTMTCKKLNGSTTSMTFTLNDASSPTSITRAT